MALSYYFNSHETVNITNANYNGGNAITLASPMNCVINVVNANYNSIGIYIYNSSPCDNNIITVVNANNNSSYGINLYCACHNTFNITNVNNNGLYGLYLNMSSDNIINGMQASGNVTAQIFLNAGVNYLNRAVLGAGVEVAGYFTGNADPKLFSQFHGGGVYSCIYTDGGQINSQDTDRPGGTGKMWKMAIATQAASFSLGFFNLRLRTYPLTLSVAKIAVSANSLVTVTAWMRKDNAISIGSGLMCKGGQLAGVATDVIKYNNNITDWENLSISFTPTEVGVIEILAFAFWNGDAANAYVGELTVSQA